MICANPACAQEAAVLRKSRTRAEVAAFNTRHGHAVRGRATRTYQTWQAMWEKCRNPKRYGWKNNGAVGISVCERWRDYTSFLSDMGEQPDGLALRRKNEAGNYEPGNCLWGTPTTWSRQPHEPRVTINGGVATLNLPCGRTAILDAVDAGLLDGWNWQSMRRHRRWYALGVKSATSEYVYLQNLIIKAPPGKTVDHRNLDGLDNRRENLRVATGGQQNANKEKISRRTSSRFKGVYYVRACGTWCAQIQANGDVRTSTYRTEEEAARTYDAWARELFGEFARTNFPVEKASA